MATICPTGALMNRAAGRRGPLLYGGALLAAAAFGTVLLAPSIALRFSGSSRPSYVIVSLTGATLIVMTSLFLAFCARVIGLTAAWLVLAVVYNGCVLIVKFILSPISLYENTFVKGGLIPAPPGSPFLYLAAGAALFAYGAVFVLVHRVFRHKLRIALADPGVPHRPVGACMVATSVSIWLGCAGLTLLGLSGVYLGAVLAWAGGALLLLLALALAAAIGAFDRTTALAIEWRDPTILTTFMWLGLSLLVFYHVLWVVFAMGLVNLWPLKTVSPSGK